MEFLYLTADKIKNKVFTVDKNGGIIGSGNCLISIEDSSLYPQHIKISFDEGIFTILPLNGAHVFFNNSFSKLSDGYEVAIDIGDTFQAGDVSFKVIDASDKDKIYDSEPIHKLKINTSSKKDNTQIQEERISIDSILNAHDLNNIKETETFQEINTSNNQENITSNIISKAHDISSISISEDIIHKLIFTLVKNELSTPILQHFNISFDDYLKDIMRNKDDIKINELILMALQNYENKTIH